MNKYRKSLLSVAAIAVISSSMLSANYLPLTTTVNDGTWMLFGVNGIAGESSSGGNAGEFSITNDPTNVWIDTNLADGLPGTSNTLGTVELVTATSVEVRVDTASYTAKETDPLRTIYVVDEDDTDPLFSFSYKAALEGEKLEYKIGNNDVQYITIDSTNTYSDPANGDVTVSTIAVSGGASLNSLTDVTKLAIDYNLTNNPPKSSEYSIASYQDLAEGNDSLRMYSFDATNATWKLFDSDNNLNDFETIEKGKGYWAKLDADENNATTNLDGQEAGLVLGSGTISATEYENIGLTYDAWNLISFDNTATQIRSATTGMILTVNAALDGNITISDASGNNEVVVNSLAGTILSRAQQINYEINRAKVFGTLPRVFDIKAFPVSATQMILMSNKKFGIEDDAANDVITAVSTIAGAATWNATDTAELGATGDPAIGKTIQSVYGEYSLIVEPLTGAGTADIIGATKVEIVTQDATGTETPELATINTDLNTSTAALNTTTNGLLAYAVDVNQSGTNDYTLMAAPYPFYIRDATASRVFKYVAAGTDNVVDIDGLTTPIASLTLTDSNATNVATLLTTGEIIAGDSGDNIVVIAPRTAVGATSTVDFTVKHVSGGDSLVAYENGNPIVENSDLDKGSIKAVFAPSVFIKADTISSLDINVSSIVGVTDQNVTLSFLTIADQTLTAPEIISTSITSAASFESAFSSAIDDLNLTTTTLSTSGDILTIEGTDIIAVYADINTTGSQEVNSTNGLGFINTASLTKLTPDLKFNSVYTPNYVIDGPLYTLRGVGTEGYKLSALVTGYTHLGDTTVAWESVDLTRPTKDWLLSQDYNLFDTDEQAGYWAYLEHPIASTLAIDTVTANATTLTGTINSYIDGTTTTNYFTGQLDLTVTGISQEAILGDAVRVIATVNGEDIEMTRSSSTSITDEEVYTAKINLQELTTTPITGGTYPIDVRVYDGVGGTLEVLAVKTIDNTKPDAPVVTQVATGVDVGAVDGATKYYVFSGGVPEKYASVTYPALATFTAGGSASGLCAVSAAVNIASSAQGIKVVAVDGTGEIGEYANISDLASATFMPIGKDRVVLSDYNDLGDTTVSTGGTDYNTSCEGTGTYTTNEFGISVASLTDDTTTKLAYTKETLVNAFGVPVSLYLSTGAASDNALIRIDYAEEYIGTEVFILIRETITTGVDVYQTYGITFPARADAEATSDLSPRVLLIGEQFTGVTF